MSGPYVLIVDDDPALLRALPQTLYLRMDDIKIDTCDSAREALELIQQHDYDAIVSDIKMPGMDGLELLEHVRGMRPETPTLLITGHGEYELAIRAIRGSAYDFIQKPIDRETFVAALQRAIQTHQLRRKVIEQHIELAQHARRLEALVEKRTSELTHANATKDKFLRIVSHELKAPLSNLKELAQVLRHQLDQPDSVDLVKRGLMDMGHSIERTEVFVQDLLDTSLMEGNLFVLNRSHCNLVALCHTFLQRYTEGAGPELTGEFLDKPLEAEVDGERVAQVLLNLLSNARKYSPRGTPITVTLQQVGYEALLSVRDRGVGIPAEALPHIFEQFYRAPGVEVQNGAHSGLGLGLYIARKIVERHGGRIEAQSTPGEGSSFSVTLPLCVEQAAEEADTALFAPQTHAVWTIMH
jgi:signal transduction histidine kinase